MVLLERSSSSSSSGGPQGELVAGKDPLKRLSGFGKKGYDNYEFRKVV